MMCNGMLAGLVAITAPCAFVNRRARCVIGVVAGILVVEAVFFFDKVGIDDSVGAISVHGVNGAWGCLSLGCLPTAPTATAGTASYVMKWAEEAWIGRCARHPLRRCRANLWAQLIDAATVAIFRLCDGLCLVQVQ